MYTMRSLNKIKLFFSSHLNIMNQILEWGKLLMKIYIFGSVGSGKTTLAKEVSKLYNIPHFEVDCIVWESKNNIRTKRSVAEQIDFIEKIDMNSKWIIEGTYRDSCCRIIEKADKVILLNTPQHIRIYRILLRYIKQKLGIEKSHYKSDLKMLFFMFKWTFGFERTKNEILDKIDNSKLLILNNNQNTNIF